MTKEEMKKYGVLDYYLELKKYIHNFIEINHPLTTEDMTAIINDNETSNVKTRNEVSKVLTASLMICLEEQIEKHKKFLEDLEQNKEVKPMTVEEEQKLIFEIKQQMLSTLWDYKQLKMKEKPLIETTGKKL